MKINKYIKQRELSELMYPNIGDPFGKLRQKKGGKDQPFGTARFLKNDKIALISSYRQIAKELQEEADEIENELK